MKKIVVLYEVESGTELPKSFDRKNIVCTSSSDKKEYMSQNPSLFIWCIEEHSDETKVKNLHKGLIPVD